MGADGWSYADVLPYFIKSESHDDPEQVNSGMMAGMDCCCSEGGYTTKV